MKAEPVTAIVTPDGVRRVRIEGIATKEEFQRLVKPFLGINKKPVADKESDK